MSHFDGIPGGVWYTKVQKVRGADLKLGDWLDSLNHEGARMIHGISMTDPASTRRTVAFSAGFAFGDTEVVDIHVEYDVVDPGSQVTPGGEPI